MSDIVDRLRSGAEHKTLVTTGLVNQAADEIERLKAEVSALNHAEVKLLVQVDEQDAEITRLRTLLKAIRNFPNLSTYYGTLIVAEIDAALKEDGDE